MCRRTSSYHQSRVQVSSNPRKCEGLRGKSGAHSRNPPAWSLSGDARRLFGSLILKATPSGAETRCEVEVGWGGDPAFGPVPFFLFLHPLRPIRPPRCLRAHNSTFPKMIQHRAPRALFMCTPNSTLPASSPSAASSLLPHLSPNTLDNPPHPHAPTHPPHPSSAHSKYTARGVCVCARARSRADVFFFFDSIMRNL